MNSGLMAGVLFGAAVGVVHACAVFAAQLRYGARPAHAPVRAAYLRAAWFALWTFALWVLFGSYVLLLWLVGLLLHIAARLRRPPTGR